MYIHILYKYLELTFEKCSYESKRWNIYINTIYINTTYILYIYILYIYEDLKLTFEKCSYESKRCNSLASRLSNGRSEGVGVCTLWKTPTTTVSENLFCCMNMELFGRNVGVLFWKIRLFYQDVGLFCVISV